MTVNLAYLCFCSCCCDHETRTNIGRADCTCKRRLYSVQDFDGWADELKIGNVARQISTILKDPEFSALYMRLLKKIEAAIEANPELHE